MALHTKTRHDIALLTDSMARYNNAVMRNDMIEANRAQQDCHSMIAIITQYGSNYKPKVRLKEYVRSLDNTRVNLYDHVFINGLRHNVKS